MAPPAVVGVVIGPCLVRIVVEGEIVVVGAVLCHICTLGIAFVLFVKAFFVEPAVKGAAVVEDSVQDDAHSSSVDLLDKLYKVLVACVEVNFIGGSDKIFICICIIEIECLQKAVIILLYDCEMGVDVVVVLRIVLVI